MSNMKQAPHAIESFELLNTSIAASSTVCTQVPIRVHLFGVARGIHIKQVLHKMSCHGGSSQVPLSIS